jgi:nucleoside 2-deoxyribosyltransferase
MSLIVAAVVIVLFLVASIVARVLLHRHVVPPTAVQPPRKIVVYLCSPFRGPDQGMNIDFARRVARQIEEEGAVVFAPHLFYPQFLNDTITEERNRGIEAGLEIMSRSDEVWFVLPSWRKELSAGMRVEANAARAMGKKVVAVDGETDNGMREVDLEVKLTRLRKRVDRQQAMSDQDAKVSA